MHASRLDWALGDLAAALGRPLLVEDEEPDAQHDGSDDHDAGDDNTGDGTPREADLVLLFALGTIVKVWNRIVFLSFRYLVVVLFLRNVNASYLTKFLTFFFTQKGNTLCYCSFYLLVFKTVVRVEFFEIVGRHLGTSNVIWAVSSLFYRFILSIILLFRNFRHTLVLQREQDVQHMRGGSSENPS